ATLPPDALLLRYWTSTRHLSIFKRSNLIPPLQVWGDGRVIWLAEGSSLYNDRQLNQGYLTPDQLAQLQTNIQQSGFYTWPERYGPTLSGRAETFLTIQLPNQDARFLHAFGDPSPEFATLKQQILAIPSQINNPQPFHPETGLLEVAGPIDTIPVTDQPIWPATGPDLSQIPPDGMIITGETLDFAWTQINTITYVPHYVQQNNQIYQITLAIPGISSCTGNYPQPFYIQGCS
ncbi:MAG TPA: hypothetical protein VLL52_22750, partial [Anaerolineae bacterium]|nr:hypothetical protein [Anaerolineae bacterium]